MNDLVVENPEVEKIAKILCSQSGVDPYRIIRSAWPDGPSSMSWCGYTERAKEILTALYSSEDIINFPKGFTLTPFKNSAPGDSILIGAENPEGWPLEDLLMKLCDEIQAKNRRIVGIHEPASYRYQGTNSALVSILLAAAEFQVEALQYAKDNPFDLTKK